MNIKELVLVINTVSHCKDLWEMFFTQLEKHYPNRKIYVFTDNADGLPTNVTSILYDPENNFRTQYLSCIKQVEEEFMIYLNEDYVLYDDVKIDLIDEYVNEMKLNNEISFIKTTKSSINYTENKYKNRSDLFYLNPNSQYFFSQNVGIWRTRILEKIHELGPDLHIAGMRTNSQFEVEANTVCKNLKLQGLYSYHKEPKRGKYHYDSIVFPYIATAIIKGKWNLWEYFNELYPLLMKYQINPEIRGANI